MKVAIIILFVCIGGHIYSNAEMKCDTPKIISYKVTEGGPNDSTGKTYKYTPLNVIGDGNCVYIKVNLMRDAKKGIYGYFSGELTYDSKSLFISKPDTENYYVGLLDEREQLLWIKIFTVEIRCYDSDSCYVAHMSDEDRIVVSFNKIGKFNMIDCFTKAQESFCAEDIFCICFNEKGEVIWNGDMGMGEFAENGWVVPLAIRMDKENLQLTVANSRIEAHSTFHYKIPK